MRARTVAMFAGLSVMLSACAEEGSNRGDAPSSRTSAESPAPSSDAVPLENAADHDAHAREATAAGGDAHAHHGTGDPRPLLPIMQQLGTDMVTLTHALMTDSAALVAQAAGAIANHPPIAQDDVQRIHGALGEEMHEFERLDEQVHEASVRLHRAAEAGRSGEVLMLLNEVQRGCVACHTQFRERLRTTPPQ